MALKDSFLKSGQYLFRYRGHLPLLFFLIILPATYFFDYSFLKDSPVLVHFITISSICLFSLGHILRAVIIGSSARHTSGRNRDQQVAHQLNTTGCYSMVRHPLYFANFLIWFGLLIYLANPLLGLLICAGFWLFYERIMFTEEQFLLLSFGNQFEDWARSVPAFVPNIFLYKKSSNRFSIKSVFTNEYPSIISTLTTFLILILARRYSIDGALNWQWNDAYLASSIFIFGISFRMIKHRTDWFKH